VVRDGWQGPKPGLFLGEALDGFAVSLAVNAHIGHGVHPLTPGRVEGAEGGDVQAVEKVLLHLARLFHDVRQEGAARALISEENSHFRWGGMPTTVCRSQL